MSIFCPNNTINNKNNNFQICQHLKTKTFKNQLTNCLKCGINIPSNGITSYKTQKQEYGAYFNPHTFYKNICKPRLNKFNLKGNQYLLQRRKIIDQIFDVAQKLKLSLKSIHLSVFLLDYCVHKDKTLNKQISLYAVISLFIAAKSIEKDERIPFIPQLKKQSMLSYTFNEFKQAEFKLMNILQFNVQLPTILDFLDYYTSQGILFSDDCVGENSVQDEQQNDMHSILSPVTPNDQAKEAKKFFVSPCKGSYKNISKNSAQNISSQLEQMEKGVRRLSNAILRDERYLEYDIQILSAACIALVRKSFKIENAWHSELQRITGISYDQIKDCLNDYLPKFEGMIKMKKKQQLNRSPSTNSTLTPKSNGNQNSFNAKSYLVSDLFNTNSQMVKSNLSQSVNFSQNTSTFQQRQQKENIDINQYSVKAQDSKLNAQYATYTKINQSLNNSNNNYNSNTKGSFNNASSIFNQQTKKYGIYNNINIYKNDQKGYVKDTMNNSSNNMITNRYRKPSFSQITRNPTISAFQYQGQNNINLKFL